MSPPNAARTKLQQLNHLLDARPHDADLWFQKALYFDDAMTGVIPQRTRLELVLLWYDQTLRADPHSWPAHYNYATVLRRLNRHEDALRHVVEAEHRQPDNVDVQTLLVQTLMRLGRYGSGGGVPPSHGARLPA